MRLWTFIQVLNPAEALLSAVGSNLSISVSCYLKLFDCASLLETDSCESVLETRFGVDFLMRAAELASSFLDDLVNDLGSNLHKLRLYRSATGT